MQQQHNDIFVVYYTGVIIILHKVHVTSYPKFVVNKEVPDDIIDNGTNYDKGEITSCIMFELLAISIHFSVIKMKKSFDLGIWPSLQLNL